MAVTETTMILTDGRAAEPTVSHQIAGLQRDGTLNRRKVLQMTTASIATAAAVTPPLAVKALADLPSSNPDAELLDLGRQLAALFEEYAAKREISDQAEAGWVPPELPATLKATADDLALIGHPETHGGYWSEWAIKRKMETWKNNPAIMARLNELLRLAEEHDTAFYRSRIECGAEAANDRVTEVCEKIEALTAHIRALPAMTFQGLAVKALHLTFDASSLWDEDPDDMDWDQYCLRVFATEALRHLPENLHCWRSIEALAA